jgi:hypothetical protein
MKSTTACPAYKNQQLAASKCKPQVVANSPLAVETIEQDFLPTPIVKVP